MRFERCRRFRRFDRDFRDRRSRCRGRRDRIRLGDRAARLGRRERGRERSSGEDGESWTDPRIVEHGLMDRRRNSLGLRRFAPCLDRVHSYERLKVLEAFGRVETAAFSLPRHSIGTRKLVKSPPRRAPRRGHTRAHLASVTDPWSYYLCLEQPGEAQWPLGHPKILVTLGSCSMTSPWLKQGYLLLWSRPPELYGWSPYNGGGRLSQT